MVTSVIITGFQQCAVMKGFQRPSAGLHGAKRSIEFNMLMRNVEIMVNHRKLFRHQLGPISLSTRAATATLPVARPMIANGWQM